LCFIFKILPLTADSRKSVIAHPKRKQFFELLEQGAGIEKLVKLIEPSVVNNLVLIDPSVRCKVSHFIYNCFFYS